MDADAIRVVLLEDHSILRESIAVMLERSGIRVVGQFAEGTAFVNALVTLPADVAVVDLTLETSSSQTGMTGLEVLDRIQRLGVSIRSVVLTANRDAKSISSAYQAGVYAYLYKLDATGEQLASIVRAVYRGERLVHPASMELTWSDAKPQTETLAPISDLSPRERQVLAWVGTGADNLKIAAHLDISERTVSAHITSIYRKLGHQNRTELALLARELHLKAV